MRKLETKEPVPFLTGRHIRVHTSYELLTEGHLIADDELKLGMIICASITHMTTTLTHWLALTMSHVGYKITVLEATRLLS